MAAMNTPLRGPNPTLPSKVADGAELGPVDDSLEGMELGMSDGTKLGMSEGMLEG
jgi:hypothetical protein